VFDFDLVSTSDNSIIVNGAYGGLPITYDKKSAVKMKIVESDLYKYDLLSFDTEIGFITNLSTTMYAMLGMFDEGSAEYAELIRRLKLCRMHQGNQIDKAKGIVIPDIPKEWTSKSDDEVSNNIIINKRPYFMRHLYSNYNKDYNKLRKSADIYTRLHFGLELDEFLSKDELSDDESDYMKWYSWMNPLLESPCIMNDLCRYMEKVTYNIKDMLKFDVKTYEHIAYDQDLYDKIKEIYDDFVRYNKSLRASRAKAKEYDMYCAIVRKKIGKLQISMMDAAKVAFHIDNNGEFLWNVCGDGIPDVLLECSPDKKCLIPMLDENGDIEYLGDKYTLVETEVFA